jgi:hypothetical protein
MLAVAGLGLMALGLVAAWWGYPRLAARLRRSDPAGSESESRGWLAGRRLPDLHQATAWLSPAPAAGDLQGRVVVLLFWDFTSPVCERQAKVAGEWQRRYGSAGLRVVLAHVPEFVFAQDTLAVATAVRRLGLDLPVALDADYALWRHFGIGALPHLVLADRAGTVRLDFRGPGGAYAAEQEIRRLLAASGPGTLPAPVLRAGDDEGAAGGATPPVYLGVHRAAQGPLTTAVPGEEHVFTPAFNFQVERADGVPVPVGRWFAGSEALRSTRGSASDYLALRYHGRDLYLLAAPPPSGESRIWVLQDDRWLPPGSVGADVRQDERGAAVVVVDAPRVYHVARNPAPGSHVLKLQPDRPGVELYKLEIEPFPSPREGSGG